LFWTNRPILGIVAESEKTESLDVGAVVPMPTLPPFIMLIVSLPMPIPNLAPVELPAVGIIKSIRASAIVPL
jgi:hypothetical protein